MRELHLKVTGRSLMSSLLVAARPRQKHQGLERARQAFGDHSMVAPGDRRFSNANATSARLVQILYAWLRILDSSRAGAWVPFSDKTFLPACGASFTSRDQSKDSGTSLGGDGK
jgi:hypothetical protein